jgi:hypothetical protein
MLTYSYIIITARISNIENLPTHLTIHFEDPAAQPSIDVPHMLVIPDKTVPSEHAAPLFNAALLGNKTLSPFGTLPNAEGPEGAMPMPRMGDSAKTPMRGVFWAGNSGSFMGNVALSVAQGMNAGVQAGDQLGEEDMERMMDEVGTGMVSG